MGTLRWEKETNELRARAAAHAGTLLRERKAELALAATKAAAATLAVEQTLREAELAQIKEYEASENGQRAEEAGQRLHRRQADSATAAHRARSQSDESS